MASTTGWGRGPATSRTRSSQPRLLALYAEAERQWHCVIEFAREDLSGPPVIRRSGKVRDLQVPLALR